MQKAGDKRMAARERNQPVVLGEFMAEQPKMTSGWSNEKGVMLAVELRCEIAVAAAHREQNPANQRTDFIPTAYVEVDGICVRSAACSDAENKGRFGYVTTEVVRTLSATKPKRRVAT